MDKPQINKKSSLIQIFRWFAVLPGSIVCALLVMFPIHWAVMLIQFFGGADSEAMITVDGKNLLAAIPPEILERFGYALFTPMVLIIAGAKIAPKYKFQTGIGMAIFWGLLFGFGIGVALTRHIYWGWLRYIITIALGIAGCVIGLLQVHQKQKKTADESKSLL